jgi:hypothetical protein
VSRSLSIECEWLDEPAALDPLERRTWAALRIRAAGRAVTQAWDRNSLAERTSVFVPAWPLARWIVRHWWQLLYETCPSEDVPSADNPLPPAQRDWLRRHSLRAAESGLLLPRLSIFSDGEDVCLDWQADPPDSYPQMPAEFTQSGRLWLSREDVDVGMRLFVRAVLERIGDSDEDRAARLRDNWAAIATADQEEASFCRAAARLGLDPYLWHDWDSAVVHLLESGFGEDEHRPIAADFLEATTDTRQMLGAWQWVRSVRTAFDLKGSPVPMTRQVLQTPGSPALLAYRLARDLRSRLHLAPGRVENVEEAARGLGIHPLRYEARNDLPTRDVSGVVGWRNQREPILVGPLPPRVDNQRFRAARALFLAAYRCEDGPRLLTAAHSWSQKASRAFAAEFLAPQSELAERCQGSEFDPDDPDKLVRSLADDYKVSTRVVELQLQNGGENLACY